MSVKSCEKTGNGIMELTIETSAADFEAAVEKAYRKKRGSIRVAGFRPGKATRKIIENLYGENIFYEEAVNIIMPEAFEQAMKEQSLIPVSQPQAEIISVGKEEGLTFKITVAVYPEVTLGQYKGLEAPRATVTVSDEDVEASLANMARQNSRVTIVERPAQTGDIANIDFKGYLDGEAFEGGEGNNYNLELGSGRFVPGFEDQIVGMSAGEERDISITFPEEYHAELAGKDAVFHVKVNSVKQQELPELDDEFAKDVSELDTLDELRADIRAKLMEQRQEAAQQAFENQLMEKVGRGITADIPETMIQDQIRRMKGQLQRQVQNQGMTYGEYLEAMDTSDEAIGEEMHAPALLQIQVDLAIEAIVKAEGLEASDDDVAAEYETAAKRYGMSVESVKKYIQEEDVREQVLRSKAVSLVAENATATELVTPAPSEPEAPAASEPEAPAASEPEVSAASQPEVSAASEPEVSVASGPEAPAASEPEVSVTSEPEASVASEPEAPAASKSKTSVASKSKSSAASKPKTSAASKSKKSKASAASEPETSALAES